MVKSEDKENVFLVDKKEFKPGLNFNVLCGYGGDLL